LVLTPDPTEACTGSIKVDRRVRVRDLRILDVEPIVPVETEAQLVLDRLAPVLSGASGAAAVDEDFAVGFDFSAHRVETALGPSSFPAEEIACEIRLRLFLSHECVLSSVTRVTAGPIDICNSFGPEWRRLR
jgi:hypothetical protein